MYIDIGNTTSGNVLKNNPHMNTTKKDKNMHGFGIMNIRDIDNKYMELSTMNSREIII